MMYSWLLKKDDYHPKKDRDFFIDKSTLSIISKLSWMKKEHQGAFSFFYGLNPILKFITSVLLIIMLSFLSTTLSVLYVFSYVMLSLALIDVSDIKKILAVSFFAALFASIIFLPSALMGNGLNSLMICIKIVSTVIIINIFAYTTKNQDISRAIRVFGVPAFFILIVDITLKYIVVVGEVAVNMLYSLRVRSVGRNNKKGRSIYNIIGFLFIKSKKFSEDVHASMLCRGFDGTYKNTGARYALHLNDYLYVLANVVVITGLFIWAI